MPARTTADVSPEHRNQLSSGAVASHTLVEILVVDFAQLLAAVVPGITGEAVAQMRVAQGTDRHAVARNAMLASLASVRASPAKAWKPGAKMGVTHRMALGGALLAAHAPKKLASLSKHTSDTVRGWAAYAIARGDGAPDSLAKKIAAIKPFAADDHMGVREWAWMSVRPFIEDEPAAAIALLTPWATNRDENLRRFASEATRPRGVWCNHIEEIKDNPQMGMPILEPLRADNSLYVRNSVANWLNDASKSDPEFVEQTVARWLKESDCKQTQAICTRATRTLRDEPGDEALKARDARQDKASKAAKTAKKATKKPADE
jgi:3-methyladenine DNA glycosylase AlkC